MGTHDSSTFVCPACGASFDVTAVQRDGLVEHGCALCGTSVPPDSFA
ncbi:DUF7560 family zinc ribbon protein [Halovivax cerinus]|uniref:Small CPxCG-related zinc finger protein n=1 Tax=Halovivax cerinus TaxID=1487865 RepID=A0ABD5NQQ5_9EURY|nr:hypothetical protein [Halovivax cerinus]